MRALSAVTLLTFVLGFCPAAHSSDIDSVVQHVTEAMGGTETLRAFRNIRINMAWREQGTEFTGDYRATRDGRMRIDVFIEGGRVYSEGLDAKGAWEQQGEGADVDAAGLVARETLMHGISYLFDGIWFAKENGHRLDDQGSETVDGASYRVVKLTLKDGFETYVYINPQTWLVERQRDERAYHPAVDATKAAIESVRESFAAVCGVPQPRVSKDVSLATGEVLSERRVVAVACNLTAGELELDRPE